MRRALLVLVMGVLIGACTQDFHVFDADGAADAASDAGKG